MYIKKDEKCWFVQEILNESFNDKEVVSGNSRFCCQVSFKPEWTLKCTTKNWDNLSGSVRFVVQNFVPMMYAANVEVDSSLTVE